MQLPRRQWRGPRTPSLAAPAAASAPSPAAAWPGLRGRMGRGPYVRVDACDAERARTLPLHRSLLHGGRLARAVAQRLQARRSSHCTARARHRCIVSVCPGDSPAASCPAVAPASACVAEASCAVCRASSSARAPMRLCSSAAARGVRESATAFPPQMTLSRPYQPGRGRWCP